jgi:hypothetical protein
MEETELEGNGAIVDLEDAVVPQPQPYARCPCGKVPDAIIVECQERAKWGRVMGNCCAEWSLEFKNNYMSDPQETQRRASKAWNEAPREV